MSKHLLEEDTKQNKQYGEIISRQGIRLVYLENRVKELENLLVEERANRINDLTAIRYVAESNINNKQQNILISIAEMTAETLEQITGGIIKKKKELSSNTDQSINN